MSKAVSYYKGNIFQIGIKKYIVCKDTYKNEDAIICLNIKFTKTGTELIGNKFINIPNDEYNLTTDYVHETVLDFSIMKVLETNPTENASVRKSLNIK